MLRLGWTAPRRLIKGASSDCKDEFRVAFGLRLSVMQLHIWRLESSNNLTVAINLHLSLFDKCCFHIPVRLASLPTAIHTAETIVLH